MAVRCYIDPRFVFRYKSEFIYIYLYQWSVQHGRKGQTWNDHDSVGGWPRSSGSADGVNTMRPRDHESPVGCHGGQNPWRTSNACIIKKQRSCKKHNRCLADWILWKTESKKCCEWWRMWPGGSALWMRCFMQGYLVSRPQVERGALGSAVVDGGVKMKLLAIGFCGNRCMAKASWEDRLAHLSICWRRTPGSPETACQQWWMTGW